MQAEYSKVDWNQYKATLGALKAGQTKLEALPQDQRANFDRASSVIDRYKAEKQQLREQVNKQKTEIQEIRASNAELAKETDKAVFWGKVGSYGLLAIHSTDAAANAAVASGIPGVSAVGYGWLTGRHGGETALAVGQGAGQVLNYVQQKIGGAGEPGPPAGRAGAPQGAAAPVAGGAQSGPAKGQPGGPAVQAGQPRGAQGGPASEGEGRGPSRIGEGGEQRPPEGPETTSIEHLPTRAGFERAVQRSKAGEELTDDSKAPYSRSSAVLSAGGAAFKVATSLSELNEARLSGDRDSIARASLNAEKETVVALSTLAETAIKRREALGRAVGPMLEHGAKGLGKGEQIMALGDAAFAAGDAYWALQDGDRSAALDHGLKASRSVAEAIGKAFDKDVRFAAPVNAVIAARNAYNDYQDLQEIDRLRSLDPNAPLRQWDNRVQGYDGMLDNLEGLTRESGLP